MSHDMAHEMGHGAGMDMQAMVRDMRNRFWISLVFTVPIFIYSPMGNMFTPPAPPFGLRLDLWLFFLASAAVLYSAWPFVIAAMRALRNRILNMAVLVLLSVRRSPNFPLLGDLQRHFASQSLAESGGRRDFVKPLLGGLHR